MIVLSLSYLELIRVPPQEGRVLPLLYKATIHGYSFTSVLSPPTTRLPVFFIPHPKQAMCILRLHVFSSCVVVDVLFVVVVVVVVVVADVVGVVVVSSFLIFWSE